MKKIYIVTLDRLNRAIDVVRKELDTHGLWTKKMADVEVFLETFNPMALSSYGWHIADGKTGSISIPSLCLPRLVHALKIGPYYSLRSILRHEYGHAIADLHPGLLRRFRFAEVFGNSYESGRSSPYDPEAHVSRYASSEPAEDHSEVFEMYLRHKGRLPTKYDKPLIRAKWRFLGRLFTAVKKMNGC